jgi:hypothetical protein
MTSPIILTPTQLKSLSLDDNEISKDKPQVDESEKHPSFTRGDTMQPFQSLLLATSSTDRGQYASKAQEVQIESIITNIEASYAAPEETPTVLPSIYGTWELIYSNTQLFRSSPFFMAGRAVCKSPEEAKQYDWFCDMHRAALAVSNIGKVRQIITKDGRMISEFEVRVGSVPFLSDFTPLKYSGGWPVTIDGAIVSSADATPTADGVGWELLMDTVEIKGSNIPLLRQILDNGNLKLESRSLGSFLEENVAGYTNPRPIFSTTYLDKDIRISRDQDGKIFVYKKESDTTEPTDYSNVDADLGVLKLLKGINDNFLKLYI